MRRLKKMNRWVVGLLLVVGCCLSGTMDTPVGGGHHSTGNPPPSQCGLLYLIGGGNAPECLADFAARVGNGRVVILPHASGNPQRAARIAERDLRAAGVKQITVLMPGSNESLPEDTVAAYMTGGEQERLLEKLREPLNGSKDCLLFQLKTHFQAGMLVCGTSAGAAAVTESESITGWQDATQPKLAPGLGLLSHAVVDMHINRREKVAGKEVNREVRLRWAAEHLGVPGIGLPEGTGVCVSHQIVDGRLQRIATVTGRSSDRSTVIFLEPRQMEGSRGVEILEAHFQAGETFELP